MLLYPGSRSVTVQYIFYEHTHVDVDGTRIYIYINRRSKTWRYSAIPALLLRTIANHSRRYFIAALRLVVPASTCNLRRIIVPSSPAILVK